MSDTGKDDTVNPQDAAADDGDPAAEADALRAEIAGLKDQALRALAEAENVRRRAKRDVEETAAYAIAKFARDLLSVSDNFARALKSVPDSAKTGLPDSVTALIDGVAAIERELSGVLARHGVTRIEAEGARFDPNLHQAIAEVPSAEVQAGHVAAVAQDGYTIGGRLLRPAMVAVAKAGDGGQRPDGGGTPGASVDTTA